MSWIPFCQFWRYYDYSFSIYVPLGESGSDWSRDPTTLIFDLLGHGVCGLCGSSSSIRIPSLKFVGLAIRKMWHTMCVSINGPADLLTLKLVVCKSHLRWGTFLPNLGTLDLWVLELFAIYATNRQTDRRADGQSNAYCPFPTGGGIISKTHVRWLIRSLQRKCVVFGVCVSANGFGKTLHVAIFNSDRTM